MNINFRQGIVTANGDWLSKTGNSISISSNVLFTLSEEDTNYLWSETTNLTGWTVNDNQKTWLYLDISKDNATRSFGITTLNPFVYSLPSSPVIGQMYYDTNEYRFKEWSGQYWVDVLRVFVGYVDNGILTKQPSGTQVNAYDSSISDYIVFGINGLPIKKYGDTSFVFYNKSTITNFKNDQTDTLSYSRTINVNGKASEAISSFKFVGWSDYKTLKYADYSLPAVGIAEVSVNNGDILSFQYEGFVQNKDWQFSQPPNTNIFLSNNGDFTTTIDYTNSIQRLGYIVSPNTIYLDIGETLSKNSPSISLSPTPLPTLTPNPTPLSTLTPTPNPNNYYSDKVISDSPMYYWFRQDTVNVDVVDDVINGNNLTITPLPTTPVPTAQQLNIYGTDISSAIVSDGYGAYMNFDGVTESTMTTAIPLATNFSLEAWVNITGGTYPTIFGDGRVGAYGLQFYVPTVDRPTEYTLMYDGESVYFELDYIFSTLLNYHVVLCIIETSAVAYVNGQAVPIKYYDSNNNIITALSGPIDFVVQHVGTDADHETFTGIIGDPAIYTYVLDADTVSSHYSLGISGRYSNNIVAPTPTPTPLSPSATPTPTPTISLTPSVSITPSVSPAAQATYTANLNRFDSSGNLDGTFANLNLDDYVSLVTQTTNGPIYISGGFTTVGGNSISNIARFNSSGVLDSSYQVTIDNSGNYIYQTADGKIYILGDFSTINSTSIKCIARFNSDGTFDTTYTPPYNFPYYANLKIAQTSDGYLYVYGAFSVTNGTTTYNAIVRLNSDGSIDNSFVPITALSSGDVFLQTNDGHIYVGGMATNSSSSTIIRLTSAGVYDSTYTPITTPQSFAKLIQTVDNYIYVVGNFYTINSSTYTSFCRLNSDGTLDTTFVDKPFTISASSFSASDIIQANDGNIYVAYSYGSGSTYAVRLIRFNSTASSYTTVFNHSLSNSGWYLSTLKQTSDGHIYLGGYYD